MNHPRNNPEASRGFTFIELLVVITVIGMLATLFLPVMAKAKGKSMSMSAQCLNNHRQLIAAAIMYADENQDWWPLNQPVGGPTYLTWCSGLMDWRAANTDNTNTLLIMDPTRSVLAPFLPAPQILHCPADKSYVTGEGARVRSVSMSQTVGTSPIPICNQSPCAVNGQWLTGSDIGNICQTQFATFGKTSQMTVLTPAMLWVFTDEHPDSINEQSLAVQCVNSTIAGAVIDYPASYHAGAGTFSFADGHVELHKWTSQYMMPPPLSNVSDHLGQARDLNGAADLSWLQAHTSVKLQ